jgi:hypothetical protein
MQAAGLWPRLKANIAHHVRRQAARLATVNVVAVPGRRVAKEKSHFGLLSDSENSHRGQRRRDWQAVRR